MDNKKFKIVKVTEPTVEVTATQLSPDELFEKQKALPTMPQLYLELIENKDKIKQTLLQKEYDPSDTVSEISYFQRPSVPRAPLPVVPLGPSVSSSSENVRGYSHHNTRSSMTSTVPRPIHPASSFSIPQKVDDNSVETRSTTSSFHDDHASSSHHSGSSSDRLKNTPHSRDDDDESIDFSDQSETPKPMENDDDDSSSLHSNAETVSDHHFQQTRPFVPQSSQKQRYQQMLSSTRPRDEYQQQQSVSSHPMPPPPPPRHAPKLSELEQMGHIRPSSSQPIYPDLARLQSKDADKEDEIKRELLFKFDLLRKSYKTVHIPEYTMNTDLRQLSRAYENTLRRVTLDSSVENYKSYMIGGFMLMEYLLNQWFQLDMQGFTQQQILNMNQYERLFIELGEKAYVPGGSPWPVEVRLLTTVVMNAIVFCISKMVLKKTGNNVMSMMGFNNTSPTMPNVPGGVSTPNPQHTSSTPSVHKRKMQGPSIDLQDLPDI